MDPPPDVCFDGWVLHRRSGELLRDGRRVRLQAQPLAVLEALLERPGELVTREELIARLWPRGVVEFDTALNTAVRRLRTALDDHAETPRYVETVPRRGYRFIGSLDEAPPQAGPPATLAPTVEPATLRRAWRWPTLAATAVIAAVATAAILQEPAREAVPGPVPVELPAAASAEDRYRLAQHFFQRRGTGDLERARQHFEAALAEQPDFAAAWSGLAGVYWIETVEGMIEPAQGLSKLRDAAEHALAVDPRQAHAHLRLSQYRSVTGDAAEATWHARMAASLAPDDPLVLVFAASRAASDGRIDEAISLQRRVLEAEPLSAVSRYNLAWYLVMAGRVDEADQELRALRELDPGRTQQREVEAIVLLLQGHGKEALDVARDWPDSPDRRQMLALAYHAVGDRAGSDEALATLVACCSGTEPLRVAEVHAFRGEANEAFRWLEQGRVVERRRPWEPGSRREPWMLLNSPLTVRLRDDPRWAAWAAAVQAPGTPDRMAASR